MANDITKQMFLDAVNRLMTAIRGHSHPEKANTHSPVLSGLPKTSNLVYNETGVVDSKQILNYDSLMEILLANVRLGKRQSVVYGPMDKYGYANYFKYSPNPTVTTAPGYTYKHVVHFNNGDLINGQKGNEGLFYDSANPTAPWSISDKANVVFGTGGGFANTFGEAVKITKNGAYIRNSKAPAQYEGSWSESMFFAVNSVPDDDGNWRCIYESRRVTDNADRGVIIGLKKISGANPHRLFVRMDTNGGGNELEINYDFTYSEGVKMHVNLVYDAVNFAYHMFVDGIYRGSAPYTQLTASGSQPSAKNKIKISGDHRGKVGQPVFVTGPVGGPNVGQSGLIKSVSYSNPFFGGDGKSTITFFDEFTSTFANGSKIEVRHGNIFQGNTNKTIVARQFGTNKETNNQHQGKVSIDEYIFMLIDETVIDTYVGYNNGAPVYYPPVPTAELVLNNYDNTVVVPNPKGYGVGILLSGAYIFTDTLFDVFSVAGKYSVDTPDFAFNDLCFNNKHFVYVDYNTTSKGVSLGWTLIAPQYGQAFVPGLISNLAFTGVDMLLDRYGNNWTFDATKFVVDSSISPTVGIFNGQALATATDAYLKSDIGFLPERWTMKLRFAVTSLTAGDTPVELICFTDDSGVKQGNNTGLMIKLIRIINGSDTVGQVEVTVANQTPFTVDLPGTTYTNVNYELELYWTGSRFGVRVQSDGNAFDPPTEITPNAGIIIGTGYTLSLGSTTGKINHTKIYGFELAPFVLKDAPYSYGNTGEAASSGPGSTVGEVMLTKDYCNNFDILANVMYTYITHAEEPGGIPGFGSDLSNTVRVFIGDITLDNEKVIEINSYAVNGRYVSQWTKITAGQANIEIPHCVGTNEVSVEIFMNKNPTDRLKWKETGAMKDTNIHGASVIDITSTKAKLTVGSGGVANKINNSGNTLSTGYAKILVERNW